MAVGGGLCGKLPGMKVSLRVSPFASIQETVAFTQRVEAAGFDGIGFLGTYIAKRFYILKLEKYYLKPQVKFYF